MRVTRSIFCYKNARNLTLEQPGVNAPGTAKTTPFLLPNSSARFTLLVGDPSYRAVVGNLSPTYAPCHNKSNSTDNDKYLGDE